MATNIDNLIEKKKVLFSKDVFYKIGWALFMGSFWTMMCPMISMPTFIVGITLMCIFEKRKGIS